MNWIELKDSERFLHYAAEHGDASFLQDGETESTYFRDCSASPSALVPDAQEYHMDCIDDYLVGLKEVWSKSDFRELDLLVRIVAAAALRESHLYQREMHGGLPATPTAEQLANVAKPRRFPGCGDDIQERSPAAPPTPKPPRELVSPVIYEF